MRFTCSLTLLLIHNPFAALDKIERLRLALARIRTAAKCCKAGWQAPRAIPETLHPACNGELNFITKAAECLAYPQDRRRHLRLFQCAIVR